ncbi:MAG: hypothetical protein Q9162_004520, partial [Coniocarpon cinnabarinum]
MAAPKPKRTPTVLVSAPFLDVVIALTKLTICIKVTDSRDAPQRQPVRPAMAQRSSTRLISVDNVLQYASEIPSGQRRAGPQTPRNPTRPAVGNRPTDARPSGGRMIQNHMPPRTTKVSEKLVLLPEAEQDVPNEKGEFDDDEEVAPMKDEDADRRMRPPTSMREKSYAERLPKSSRTEKLPRVTAYCTAQAYKMRATAEFVRSKHGAKTKLYDDCLYTVYHLPLLPGHEGYRIQSSPVLKSPGGKAVLDEEIERNERHEYREGFFGEEQYGVRGLEDSQGDQPRRPSEDESRVQTPPAQLINPTDPNNQNSPAHPYDATTTQQQPSSPTDTHADPTHARLAANLANFAEMFIYSYGVVVFWNFTSRQEKDILADLTFTSSPAHNTIPLAVRPQAESDFETEEFHFEYNPRIPRPRLFNDMITLRSGDHMIKLAMSHAIAQSTKLSFFEERMADTMDEAQSIPRRLALQGDLGMKREEVVRILGRLFMSRVDVNLSSNMLDVPNFFWESEPTLHPLYTAVREYLEIKPRIQVLNERCRVFLDLAEILSDSIAERKMSRITWIIIILIVVSILVTVSEVVLRFGIVQHEKGFKAPVGTGVPEG